MYRHQCTDIMNTTKLKYVGLLHLLVYMFDMLSLKNFMINFATYLFNCYNANTLWFTLCQTSVDHTESRSYKYAFWVTYPLHTLYTLFSWVCHYVYLTIELIKKTIKKTPKNIYVYCCGALTGPRNSSMGPSRGIVLTNHAPWAHTLPLSYIIFLHIESNAFDLF